MNSAYQQISGAPGVRLGRTAILQLLDPADRSSMASHLQNAKSIGPQKNLETRLLNEENKLTWTRWRIASVRLRSDVYGLIHTIEDITTNKARNQASLAAMSALSCERERARVTLEAIGDAVISTDANGHISYMNPVAERLTGWSRESAQNQPFSQVFRVVHSGTRETVVNPAQRAIDTAQIVQLAANSRLLRFDGSELDIEDSAAPILDASGKITGAVVIFRDRKFSRATYSRMSHLATHDHLTGLVNRSSLTELFDQSIKYARRRNGGIGVIFIDMDRFKAVNDALGHEAGDRLLQNVARELTKCVRETDAVCRYGGDEFVVLLSEIDKPEDAVRIARNISTTIQNFLKRKQTSDVSLSLGISVFPKDGDNPRILLKRADIAMYAAKAQGGGGICLFGG